MSDPCRCFQDIHISKNVKMIDSPGIVAAQSNPKAAMALRSLQVEDKQETVLEAVRTLLKQCNKQQVRRRRSLLLTWAPEWRSSLRDCISVLEVSLLTLVQSRAVSQPAVIWESHRAVHNWPSIVRVWPGVDCHCK